MSYNKKKVPVYDAKTGYDLLAKDYTKHHKFLDSWDKGTFVRFLPTDLSGKKILDLGAGDGRIGKHFLDKGIKGYVACDISENMLNRCPSRMEKVCTDLEQALPFSDQEFDIILGFFVLLHINNLQHILDEAYRVLKPGGRLIILHHTERHNTFDSGKFKIKTYNHRYADVEKMAEYCFFEQDSIDLVEKGMLIAKLYCMNK